MQENGAHKATITCLLVSTAIFSAHNAKWPDALSPLTGGGGHRSQGRRQQQIPLLVCLCVPVVIITRIRAEPNPRGVPPLRRPIPDCSSDPQIERRWEAEQRPRPCLRQTDWPEGKKQTKNSHVSLIHHPPPPPLPVLVIIHRQNKTWHKHREYEDTGAVQRAHALTTRVQ